MNGVHDLGGMDGFGAVDVEANEPVFHHAWEGVVFALAAVMSVQRLSNTDAFRHAIERMDPAHYLSSPYYEHWLTGLATLLVEKGVITRAELEARVGGRIPLSRPVHADALVSPTPSAAGPRSLSDVAARSEPTASGPAAPMPAAGPRSLSDVAARSEPTASGPAAPMPAAGPRFAVGSVVRVRNLHPHGHTRCPRYVRGKRGTVVRVDGCFPLPDVAAHGGARCKQHTYAVRFTGQELWGDTADRAAGPAASILSAGPLPYGSLRAAKPDRLLVHVDLWESYLESP